DAEASELLKKSLKKKNIDIKLNHQLIKVQENSEAKTLIITSKQGEETKIITDELLIAVGRTPNTQAVRNLDIKMNKQFIQVNEYMETNLPDISAVGDVVGNYQLAHVASKEGLIAVNNLTDQRKKTAYNTMPRCVYTSPQVASVGLSEAELKERIVAYKVNKYSFASNGMALASDEKEGFSKVMVDKKYGEILGVIMVGTHVTEMISQPTSYMYLEGTVEELADMVQPHPSLSESLMESANALIDTGVHVS